MLPMMMVGASRAIWWYASAKGLEVRFCRLAEGDVGVDDVELSSVPDDFVGNQSPWDAEVVDKMEVDARQGI